MKYKFDEVDDQNLELICKFYGKIEHKKAIKSCKHNIKQNIPYGQQKFGTKKEKRVTILLKVAKKYATAPHLFKTL